MLDVFCVACDKTILGSLLSSGCFLAFRDCLSDLDKAILEHFLVDSAEAVDFLFRSLAGLDSLFGRLDGLLVALRRILVARGDVLQLLANLFKVCGSHVLFRLGSLELRDLFLRCGGR